jgi:nucleoside-diphosphate-sugar epimerase
LQQLSADQGPELVIIRPPLVYGPQAPGNFGALSRLVKRGWPLPLGAVHNQRSLISRANLVDFILTCCTHPKAAGQTFLVSDGADLSTTELVRGMARAAGVRSSLWPVPVWALRALGQCSGRSEAVLRLCGNLQLDMSKAREVLGWVPPLSVEEGLRQAMEDPA